MLLSKRTTLKVTDEQSNVIGHMTYAARKLWNICNYERHNHKELGFEKYPDWYYQKSAHKENIWFKSLPSQSAQEVCKLLDKAWKSFYALLKTGGVENPKPPCFKKENIPVTYMQNGVKRTSDTQVRLAVPKALKQHMSQTYGIDINYLYLENKVFQGIDLIKQIKLYPPENGKVKAIVVYEVAEPDVLPDNGRYLSIDLGLHNTFTCYSSLGESFIIGRKLLSIMRYYDKEIAHYQGVSDSQQVAAGVKYPKPSKRVKRLYQRKKDSIKDYLHKCTRAIISYCESNDIHTLVIGDLTGIREDTDFGHITNQKFHAFSYAQIYLMLEYKCRLAGISFVKISEAYSSQCSPVTPEVSEEYATPNNRKNRGLYVLDKTVWNADSVGAYNILRLYSENKYKAPTDVLSSPYLLKVAV